MYPSRKDPETWRRLRGMLDGRLTASARGLLTPEYVLLDREGAHIGKLDVHGPAGADLTAGDVEAQIRRVGRHAYVMLSSGEEILTSSGGPASPEITSCNHPYITSISLLRNRAEAGPEAQTTTVRIEGGLTNRTYEASFDPDDENSIPIAILLIYHLVSQRSKAYVTG